MTNDTKRHQRELADSGDRHMRRATLYHLLLKRVVGTRQLEPQMCRSIDPDYLFDWQCPICDAVAREQDEIDHHHDCLIAQINRALAADHDTISAMIAAMTGGDDAH